MVALTLTLCLYRPASIFNLTTLGWGFFWFVISPCPQPPVFQAVSFELSLLSLAQKRLLGETTETPLDPLADNLINLKEVLSHCSRIKILRLGVTSSQLLCQHDVTECYLIISMVSCDQPLGGCDMDMWCFSGPTSNF